jgi:hypothetical protein
MRPNSGSAICVLLATPLLLSAFVKVKDAVPLLATVTGLAALVVATWNADKESSRTLLYIIFSSVDSESSRTFGLDGMLRQDRLTTRANVMGRVIAYWYLVAARGLVICDALH